ncbi:MAG: accessory gene regulator B family protein [Eubacterium sp.]|nr:accessory gene regulator B family protein [Eubacterium sp.]
MNYLASILTEKLLKYSLIDFEIRENYKYAIQVHLEQIIGFSILLIISILCGFCCETIVFIIFFTYVRRYSGGFHMRNFYGCVFCSVVTYLGYVKCLYLFLLRNMRMNMILVIISTLIILFVGAVNHPKMHWNVHELNISRNCARVVAMMELGCIILLLILKVSYSYILFMSFGLTLSAIMLLLAKILRQEVTLYEKRS